MPLKAGLHIQLSGERIAFGLPWVASPIFIQVSLLGYHATQIDQFLHVIYLNSGIGLSL